ncbi:4Fe-4S dicluster domain-containing protein [Aureimonas sp. AU20]|uniref:4Fe-4S dicluster domain-containing protein n=1 Tax=Aureimonas sp. AU20 TaxID=1349819 RepID=UPI00072102B3|nr:4Fe-4S dicluster domain-containing protein [Aureimonas sp. AU20]ALN72615.1 hypothetical protein M673_07820 [Aureimonas sp. AU20]
MSGAFDLAPLNRRDALRLLAGGMAATLAGCKPAAQIVPAVAGPGGWADGLPVGEPLRFATALPLGGYGRGVLATSVDGRPIKISGNERHPASLGATDIFSEADVLGLYDPGRSRTVLKQGQIATLDGLLAELAPRLDALRASGGAGLAILTGRITSPTLLRQMAALQAAFPAMAHYRHEAVHDDQAQAGAEIAFGRRLDLLPQWERADLVLCLSADPLGFGPAQLRNAAGYAARRARREPGLRLYAVESALSLTGSVADHRQALAPDAIARFADTLMRRFQTPLAQAGDDPIIEALVRDLVAAGPRALVLVGEDQPPELHALGLWLNGALGSFGTALDLIEPVDPHPRGHGEDIATLAGELDAGRVDTLLILGANPAYDAPADLDFAQKIHKAGFSLHLGLQADETAAEVLWHVPESHPLEHWSDLRAVDGTAAIAQPLIRPLYETLDRHRFIALLLGERDAASRDLVRATWAERQGSEELERWWLRVVEDGVIPGTAATPLKLSAPAVPPPWSPPAIASELALTLRPDSGVWDGRYANNAWLQECPRPVTHEVWTNALRIHPEDAASRNLAETDAVRIEANGRAVEAPLLFDPAQARGALTLTLGYGRTRAGAIGNGLGTDAYRLRTTASPWQIGGVRLTVAGEADAMPRTPWTLDEHGPDVAPAMALRDLLAGQRLRPAAPPPQSFYPTESYETAAQPPGETYAWGMVIDTDLCIGCNACVVACQSENNVPVVGPDEIRRGRDMHWLRIDSYREPEGEARARFQPVPCMHCEKAPCEPVCPVGASVHDHEGLNNQVYNRCVGTRFCQANCPYKVRRFNFFGYGNGQEYANLGKDPLPAHLNPDVTVRGRGVMEKCTYCVQRISGARRDAEAEGRRIREGEVTTACASACPTKAIRFGDLNGEASAIRALRDDPRHYTLLEELGTRPRTTYLAAVSNPAGPEEAAG